MKGHPLLLSGRGFLARDQKDRPTNLQKCQSGIEEKASHNTQNQKQQSNKQKQEEEGKSKLSQKEAREELFVDTKLGCFLRRNRPGVR
jgi:hypothetical protein